MPDGALLDSPGILTIEKGDEFILSKTPISKDHISNFRVQSHVCHCVL